MVNLSEYKVLNKVSTPSELRKLNIAELPALCADIRKYIINVLSVHPGHLGSSLGAVELAVAIHYVFNTPYDNLVWDVGHQAYAHKILTGRRDLFETIRQLNGLSGFPKISESEYDAFGTGHASTSVSAAFGMAIAAKENNETDRNSIAVVGDGSATGGMIFEAINNAGANKANILIILNDNGISIDKSVGGLKEHLLNLAVSKKYNKFRNKIWNYMIHRQSLKKNPKNYFIIQQIKRGLKSSLLNRSNFFEALGVRYFGPIDGNDVIQLVDVLKHLKAIKGPKLFHCITVKGKGLPAAENDQVKFHSPGRFDSVTGQIISNNDSNKPMKYQDVFGETIIRLARDNKKIIGVSPAMLSGSSLCFMNKVMPERCFDVGIAEEHAVTFCGGMAARGMRPYLVIYSTFLQRGYDQIIHDIALQKLPVVLCIDRAGIVGDDGPTHHGAFDLAYLRSIPNMIISAAMDEYELQDLMFTAQSSLMPFAIRYPRGCGQYINSRKEKLKNIKIGTGRKIIDGEKVAILTIGKPGNFVTEAIELLHKKKLNVNPAHYDMRFLKPLDVELLDEICRKFKYIITVEDGTIVGGFGSAILEYISDKNYPCNVKRLGIPDKFIEQGKPEELYRICGFDAQGIAATVENQLEMNNRY